MKNKLYTVLGGKWDDENGCWNDVSSMKYTAFKNKDKALSYKETLLDQYMKTKSYSPNYTIGEVYRDDNSVIDTYITCISNKKGSIVYCTEVQEIDLTDIVL